MKLSLIKIISHSFRRHALRLPMFRSFGVRVFHHHCIKSSSSLMNKRIQAAGPALTAVYYCEPVPHGPDVNVDANDKFMCTPFNKMFGFLVKSLNVLMGLQSVRLASLFATQKVHWHFLSESHVSTKILCYSTQRMYWLWHHLIRPNWFVNFCLIPDNWAYAIDGCRRWI